MSHITRTTLKHISDKKFLLMSLSDLGYTYEEGQIKMRDFFRQEVTVEILARTPAGGKVGFRWNEMTGHYDQFADWSELTLKEGLTEKKFNEMLTPRYAYQTTRQKLEEQGFDMVEEKVEETGQIRLVLRRMA